MMKKIQFVSLLFFCNYLVACYPAKISLQNRLENTTKVSVGYVTGKQLTEFEKTLSDPTLPIQTQQKYRLRVKITENIKGNFKTDIIHPEISSCGSGGADLKDKVIVFFVDQYWYVKKYSSETYAEILALIKTPQ